MIVGVQIDDKSLEFLIRSVHGSMEDMQEVLKCRGFFRFEKAANGATNEIRKL
jgi:hypothetical protein